MSIAYSECISVALINKQEKHKRYIVFSSVACLVVPHFPHYLINGTTFEGKIL